MMGCWTCGGAHYQSECPGKANEGPEAVKSLCAVREVIPAAPTLADWVKAAEDNPNKKKAKPKTWKNKKIEIGNKFEALTEENENEMPEETCVDCETGEAMDNRCQKRREWMA